jgi:hypothetical protein
MSGAAHPWTHLGRLSFAGEPLLAMDAGVAAAWHSDDQFEELLDLGAEATVIGVGGGTAAIIGDGSVNDEGWVEVFGSGGDRLAFVHALAFRQANLYEEPYDRVLEAALAYPLSGDLDGGVVPLPSGDLVVFSSALDGAGPSAAPLVQAAPRPTPRSNRPATLATPRAEVISGLAVSLRPGAYRLHVRWRTQLDHAVFARWLLLPSW